MMQPLALGLLRLHFGTPRRSSTKPGKPAATSVGARCEPAGWYDERRAFQHRRQRRNLAFAVEFLLTSVKPLDEALRHRLGIDRVNALLLLPARASSRSRAARASQ